MWIQKWYLSVSFSKKVTCLETSPCNPNLGYQCCPEGFIGEDCNICQNNPCIHGECSYGQLNDYKCTCNQGWSGKNCDFDCASDPNGRIINGVCYIFMNLKKNYDDAIQSCKTKG